MSAINAIDFFLPQLFVKIQSPILDRAMVFLTFLGEGGLIWILAIVAMLITKKYRRAGIASAGSLLSCFLLGNYVIKPLVGRIRPCNVYPMVELIIKAPSDFSFPSMHTATAFSVAVIIFMRSRAWGTPALVLASLIAISRVYLYVHYTTDIIAGAIFGTGFALFFYWLFFKRNGSNNT